tara:strand:+ start:66 stop:224 length:159 start_codon:yes stop_codon:yes gene_type:complete
VANKIYCEAWGVWSLKYFQVKKFLSCIQIRAINKMAVAITILKNVHEINLII